MKYEGTSQNLVIVARVQPEWQVFSELNTSTEGSSIKSGIFLKAPP